MEIKHLLKKAALSIVGLTMGLGLSMTVNAAEDVEVNHYDDHYVENPTCTEPGVDVHWCHGCNAEFDRTEIEALGHDYQLIERVEPTAEADGYILYECSRCADQYSEPLTMTDGEDGDQSDDTDNADGEDGKQGDDADNTDGEDGDSEGEDANHCDNHYDDHYIEQPTCTTPGVDVHWCHGCNAEFDRTEIEALGHDYQLIERVEPTAEADGYILYECSRCADQYSEPLKIENADGEDEDNTGDDQEQEENGDIDTLLPDLDIVIPVPGEGEGEDGEDNDISDMLPYPGFVIPMPGSGEGDDQNGPQVEVDENLFPDITVDTEDGDEGDDQNGPQIGVDENLFPDITVDTGDGDDQDGDQGDDTDNTDGEDGDQGDDADNTDGEDGDQGNGDANNTDDEDSDQGNGDADNTDDQNETQEQNVVEPIVALSIVPVNGFSQALLGDYLPRTGENNNANMMWIVVFLIGLMALAAGFKAAN